MLKTPILRLLILCFFLTFPIGYLLASPRGIREEMVRTANCPNGVSVTRHGSFRNIELVQASPRNLRDLFTSRVLSREQRSRIREDENPLILRRRLVSINPELVFTLDEPMPGNREKETVRLRDMLKLSLFDGQSITARLNLADQNEDSFSWVGEIGGDSEKGVVSLTYYKGIFHGRVNYYGRGLYRIKNTGPDIYELQELDPSSPGDIPSLLPERESSQPVTEAEMDYPPSDGYIELMVLYTGGVRSQAGGPTQIKAEVADAVALINWCYLKSGIVQRISLVLAAETLIPIPGDPFTALDYLQDPGDGKIDEIHQWRKDYGADCVSLILDFFSSYSYIAGLGYALEQGVEDIFKDYAFSVVDYPYLTHNTMGHELGHNMGAGHDICYGTCSNASGPQYYSYSSGFCNYSKWMTVMSTLCRNTPRIDHFSNPDKSYEGTPTGKSGPNGNNNALTLNNTMDLVDSFAEEGTATGSVDLSYLGTVTFSPLEVNSGDDFLINAEVANYGNQAASDFAVDFYASPDMSISVADYLIGRVIVAEAPADSKTPIQWSGAFPGSIPTGSYYLGWIIDADNDIIESNESNNRIHVPSPKLAATQVCTVSIDPLERSFYASGGAGTIAVTTPSECTWTSVSDSDWITVNGGMEGTGNGPVTYIVAPNTLAEERTGQITIGNQEFAVTQAAADPSCSFSIQPEHRVHPGGGGYGSIVVSCTSGCLWEASSLEEWIIITSASAGSGEGIVNYEVSLNETGTERIGQVLVAGKNFEVIQESATTVLEQRDMVVFPADFRKLGGFFSDSFVGATVMNLNETGKGVLFRALDSDGNELSTNNGMSGLAANAQLARMTSELVSFGSQLATITAEGDGSGYPLKGLFLVGNQETTRLDGIGHQWIPSRESYLLLGPDSPSRKTLIYLFNPSVSAQAEVEIEWVAKDGSLIDTFAQELPAGGTVFKPAFEMFDIESSGLEGYFVVRSDVAVCGFTVQATVDSFVALPAQVPENTGTLFAPHFIVLPDGSGTELRIVNGEAVPVVVKIFGFRDQEEGYESPGIEIQPGAMLEGSLTEFLPVEYGKLPENGLITGMLKIELSAAEEFGVYQVSRVIGGIVIKGSPDNAAALPLEYRGRKKFTFPHVAQSLNMRIFTGLALWNVTEQSASITVRAFTVNGELSAEKSLVLPANDRIVRLLNEELYFGPDFEQVGGHLMIESDTPLVTFCLFGDSEMRYLATVGGQALE